MPDKETAKRMINEAMREAFLTEWVENATTDQIVEKLIQNDERAKRIKRFETEIQAIITEIENCDNPCECRDGFEVLLPKIKKLLKEDEDAR